MAGRPYENRLDSVATLLESQEFSHYYSPKFPNGFAIDPFEDLVWLRPGIEAVAKRYLSSLRQWLDTKTEAPFPKDWLTTNPYWPNSLSRLRAPKRLLAFLPLSIAKTRDDTGKDPWTILGGAPAPLPFEFFSAFSTCEGLASWLGTKTNDSDLCATLKKDGVRILAADPIPEALNALLLKPDEIPLILVTLEPASTWPAPLLAHFLDGATEVAPHPATLIPYGATPYAKLATVRGDARELPLAIVLAKFKTAAEGRVLIPETGDLSSVAIKKPTLRHKALKRNANDTRRTFEKLFDFSPATIELYGKPTARNSQLWGVSGPLKDQWLLHGPLADRESIDAVKDRLLKDKGKSKVLYRDYFPPQRILGFEFKWHRPVAVRLTARGNEMNWNFGWEGRGRILAEKGEQRLELSPYHADPGGASLAMAGGLSEKKQWPIAETARKILELSALLGGRVANETAEMLVPSKKNIFPTLAGFLESLEKAAPTAARAVKARLQSGSAPRVSPLTFAATVQGEHAYENQYWKWIAELSHNFGAQNNVDCVSAEKDHGHCRKNELPDVSTYLEAYYRKLGIDTHRQPFHWEMDFEVPWWGGWALNSPKRPLADIERDGHHNLIAVIPASDPKDRGKEAVILADHYDTAFMADVYDGTYKPELTGHRHASAGANDNHSATATLMAAALTISKLTLKRDVWLVHLTGEEFPADCLGARALSESLVKGTPVISGKKNPKIVALYVLDMVSHNTNRDEGKPGEMGPSVFQISPGRGERSAELAYLMHRVTLTWNDRAGKHETEGWNAQYGRKSGWERVPGPVPPRPTLFPQFRGEVRFPWETRSTLYNTDGITFSDAGIPVVLMMENYDINRNGYHDTFDTLANIDLDFGSGLSRIAIETIAQAAANP